MIKTQGQENFDIRLAKIFLFLFGLSVLSIFLLKTIDNLQYAVFLHC